jgi:hypothetical protein
MVSKGFNISKFPTEQPETRAQGTSHAWAQKLQRSQVPLEILGRRAPNPKDSALSSKNHEAQTSQNLSVTVSLWFQVSALSTSLNLDTNASEWSKKSGRLPNISKKYVDEPSKSLLPLET